jgi:acetyl-CoA C-acetyltransferase
MLAGISRESGDDTGRPVTRATAQRREKIMKTVAVAGTGKTAFGAFPDRTLGSLAVESITRCLEDACLDVAAVEAFYLGNFAGPSFVGQNHLAPYVASLAGLRDIPCTRMEAACASSGTALFHAYSAVAAGVYETVLVTGVEVMNSQATPRVTEILAAAGDTAGEVTAGATFPALFAMIARRHMHQFGTRREHLAMIAVKNHENGALNPQAHMRKRITLEQALNGKPIAEPLTVYDCSLVSDGAASVLLTSKTVPGAPVIRGIAQTSDRLALDQKDDITTFRANRLAASKAYAMAGITPDAIAVAEVHDCFTIAELIAMEDLGFCAKGEGGPYVASGATRLDGERPVNTSGGLKSKGHPVGATGTAQICDLVAQLRGRAGERQIQRTGLALAQNLGGSGATSVVTILEGR